MAEKHGNNEKLDDDDMISVDSDATYSQCESR